MGACTSEERQVEGRTKTLQSQQSNPGSSVSSLPNGHETEQMFRCSFCRTFLGTFSVVEAHELTCPANPNCTTADASTNSEQPPPLTSSPGQPAPPIEAPPVFEVLVSFPNDDWWPEAEKGQTLPFPVTCTDTVKQVVAQITAFCRVRVSGVRLVEAQEELLHEANTLSELGIGPESQAVLEPWPWNTFPTTTNVPQMHNPRMSQPI